ncbi:MAG TPA: fasciclin domain-containing protein [Nostocaceae cyanobacterium]|nr:fasciclin domain-containing protein [Nostocaceae cyanobacterium]
MKANYSKLLTKFLGVAGLSSVSLLISLPSRAEVVLNPHLNYNQQFISNSQSTTTKPILGNIAQNRRNRGGVNPSPSIFNEPPYNRGKRPSEIAPTNTPTNTTTPPPTVIPSQPGRTTPTTGTITNKNLVALAESNGSFNTLVKALKAAGLTDVLQKQGPFTIFAPTDEAFAKLPQDALKELLQPENKEVLVKVLTYHVVPGKVLSSNLTSGQVTSLQGDPITVKVDNGVVQVNDAKVIQADIQGSNGVIHKIDTVILPPSL